MRGEARIRWLSQRYMMSPQKLAIWRRVCYHSKNLPNIKPKRRKWRSNFRFLDLLAKVLKTFSYYFLLHNGMQNQQCTSRVRFRVNQMITTHKAHMYINLQNTGLASSIYSISIVQHQNQNKSNRSLFRYKFQVNMPARTKQKGLDLHLTSRARPPMKTRLIISWPSGI